MKKLMWLATAALVALCVYEICRRVLPGVIKKRKKAKAERG